MARRVVGDVEARLAVLAADVIKPALLVVLLVPLELGIARSKREALIHLLRLLLDVARQQPAHHLLAADVERGWLAGVDEEEPVGCRRPRGLVVGLLRGDSAFAQEVALVRFGRRHQVMSSGPIWLIVLLGSPSIAQ
jgi:hypothetical protein